MVTTFYHTLCRHVPDTARHTKIKEKPNVIQISNVANARKSKTGKKSCVGALINGHGFGFLIAFYVTAAASEQTFPSKQRYQKHGQFLPSVSPSCW